MKNLSFVLLNVLLFSACSNEISEPDVFAIQSNSISERKCNPRPEFFFDKHTSADDSIFKKFIAPMDSIDELIESKNLRFGVTNGFSSDAKKHWKFNGHPIKIMMSGFVENNYTSEFYLLDNCHWMHKRKTFHWSYPDSITKIEIRSYRDTTLLSALITSASNYNYFYYNLIDNKYTQSSARKVPAQFKRELQLIRY